MAAEPAEVLQAIVERVEAGEFQRVAEFIAPDGVFHGTVGGIEEAEVMDGPDGFRRYFLDVAATWDEWRLVAAQVHRNGDTFVVFWDETSRSREIEGPSETPPLSTIRDGCVVSGRGSLDRRQRWPRPGSSPRRPRRAVLLGRSSPP